MNLPSVPSLPERQSGIFLLCIRKDCNGDVETTVLSYHLDSKQDQPELRYKIYHMQIKIRIDLLQQKEWRKTYKKRYIGMATSTDVFVYLIPSHPLP